MILKRGNSNPSKWVLLPYNKNGKPLEWKQINANPALEKYLNENNIQLQNRKGVMLNAMLKRGHWWALLGVGDYNFFPFKIVWEAYGKTTFNPKIFEGNWQINHLRNTTIEDYLLSLKMEGTMNWAQPGKIKKLIQYEEECLTLF